MCNNGTIGETEERCSGAIAMQIAMMAQNPAPSPHVPSPVPVPVPVPVPAPHMPTPVPQPVPAPTYAPQPAPVPQPIPVPHAPVPAAPVWVDPQPVEVVHMPDPMPVTGDQTYEMQRPEEPVVLPMDPLEPMIPGGDMMMGPQDLPSKYWIGYACHYNSMKGHSHSALYEENTNHS